MHAPARAVATRRERVELAHRSRAEAVIGEMLKAVAEDLDGLSVERVAVEGLPAAVLIDRSVDADLLVVGSRGRGGFLALALGSVSTACVHHATCPVLVVPAPR